MRYLPFAALLFAAPAFAQTPPQTAQYEPTAAVLLRQSLQCEQLATAQYQQLSNEKTGLSNQIATQAKQIADLTKERDDLKAKEAPKP